MITLQVCLKNDVRDSLYSYASVVVALPQMMSWQLPGDVVGPGQVLGGEVRDGGRYGAESRGCPTPGVPLGGMPPPLIPSNPPPGTLYTPYLHLISSARNRRRLRPRFPFIWLPQTLASSHQSSLSLMYTSKYKRCVQFCSFTRIWCACSRCQKGVRRFSSLCNSWDLFSLTLSKLSSNNYSLHLIRPHFNPVPPMALLFIILRLIFFPSTFPGQISSSS